MTGDLSIEQAAQREGERLAVQSRLTERANDAAGDVLARFAEDATLGAHSSWLRPLLSIAWLEGWQSGGDEARAIVGEIFDRVGRL